MLVDTILNKKNFISFYISIENSRKLNKYLIKTQKNRELLIVFKSEFTEARIDCLNQNGLNYQNPQTYNETITCTDILNYD